MYFCDLANIICQNFLSVSTLVIIDFFLIITLDFLKTTFNFWLHSFITGLWTLGPFFRKGSGVIIYEDFNYLRHKHSYIYWCAKSRLLIAFLPLMTIFFGGIMKLLNIENLINFYNFVLIQEKFYCNLQ